MIEDQYWGAMCTGLVSSGICCYLESERVFQTGSGPLLNGLFGVSKDDWTEDNIEICRLIMNLVPLNNISESLVGDVDTLPSWGMMNPLFLQPGENLLVSSEDVKCSFYTMKVPNEWVKFLAFNKVVPQEVLPSHLIGHTVYLASRVLPMGFLNSVSLAQNVHRNLVSWSGGEDGQVNRGSEELRKDRSFTVANPCWRVYLDNYDLLEKVSASGMVELEGTVPPAVLALRAEYEKWDAPRNAKKGVARSSRCELQGATIDGMLGLAFPKESKLEKYFSMALDLTRQTRVSQRQMQVVCGGLVYFSMFRRQLLGTLNSVWRFIESFNDETPRYQPVPTECKLEILRFLGMLPLVRMDFRGDVHPMVTCSDASTTGGGVCCSKGLSDVGVLAEKGRLRGQVPSPLDDQQILVIGLFDGIGALRVAVDLQGVHVGGYISVESNKHANRVVEAHYPGVLCVDDVAQVDEEMVHGWSLRFSQCTLVIIGGGPPCQGVSGLNSDRRGALKDARSCLFVHVSRIRELVKRYFKWAPTHALMESVASMDRQDRIIMSEDFGGPPVSIDAGKMTWCHRPRLYWTTWELAAGRGAAVSRGAELEIWELTAEQDVREVLEPGWVKVDCQRAFPTFTTARPSERPGRRPAGLHECQPYELARWQEDLHRFPPYQYIDKHGVINRKNIVRVPSVAEREVILGFPLHYTAPCSGKHDRKGSKYSDTRLTLLGNSWSVPVIAWLLNQLLWPLGFCRKLDPQDIVDRCKPGASESLQGRLIRLPLSRTKPGTGDPYSLACKLCNLVSLKGEDIMLTTPSTQLVKFHRLRASVPARLWRWQVVSGWRWTRGREHINCLELRAILNSLRWRLEKQKHFGYRMLHLTDSLVCLHALTRGRTSSKKLRSTMSRINALLLASSSQMVWGYVSTDTNPADKPSRCGGRVKTKFRNA